MRFLMLMIPRVYQPGQTIPKNFAPPADAVERMMKFNADLQKAGVLLALDGLHPLSEGGRVPFANGKAKDGPFAEAKEVIGGYWIIQAKNKEEALEWARRVPADDGDVIEVRRIQEMEDFPADVQDAVKNSDFKS